MYRPEELISIPEIYLSSVARISRIISEFVSIYSASVTKFLDLSEDRRAAFACAAFDRTKRSTKRARRIQRDREGRKVSAGGRWSASENN